MSFDIVSPTYSVQTVTLYSRGREVEQEQLLEFITLVECLKLPRPLFLDADVKLCEVKLELKMEPGTEKLRIFYFS